MTGIARHLCGLGVFAGDNPNPNGQKKRGGSDSVPFFVDELTFANSYRNFPTRNWLISSEPMIGLPSITNTGTVFAPVS